jgi:hypothetical protein
MNEDKNINLEIKEVQEDEPPSAYNNISDSRYSRMVACFKKNLGLCEARKRFINDHSFRREFSWTYGAAKFY